MSIGVGLARSTTTEACSAPLFGLPARSVATSLVTSTVTVPSAVGATLKLKCEPSIAMKLLNVPLPMTTSLASKPVTSSSKLTLTLRLEEFVGFAPLIAIDACGLKGSCLMAGVPVADDSFPAASVPVTKKRYEESSISGIEIENSTLSPVTVCWPTKSSPSLSVLLPSSSR